MIVVIRKELNLSSLETAVAQGFPLLRGQTTVKRIELDNLYATPFIVPGRVARLFVALRF